MTRCTGSSNRHLVLIKMTYQGDIREMAVITGYRVASNAAVDDTRIGVINMTTLTGNNMSIRRMNASDMLIGNIGNMTF